MGRFTGQSNKVVFTLNNYSIEELLAIEDYCNNGAEKGEIDYAIIGDEIGESGTEHLQGIYILY